MAAKHLSKAVVVVVAGVLTGCGSSPEDRTMGGTAVGAAMGAAIGGVIGGIGAGPGALLGGVAGAPVGAFTTPDKVDFGRPLWEQYRRVGGNLPARQTERGLVLTLDPVLFAFFSAELRPGGAKEVATIATFLREQTSRQVLIEGHTDSIGADDYNLDLSERRAGTVRQALIDNGIDASRFVIQGLGEDVPVADNDTSAGRQKNRRVEVIIQ